MKKDKLNKNIELTNIRRGVFVVWMMIVGSFRCFWEFQVFQELSGFLR
jgi:hypothetical protein